MAINYDTRIPGVYFDFQPVLREALEGSDGSVAIVTANYNQTAEPGKIYKYEDTEEAQAVIGVSNMGAINRVKQGGASEIIIYTLPPADETTGEYDYTGARTALGFQFFEALTFDHELSQAALTEWTSWYNSQLPYGRYLPIFYGVNDDVDVSTGTARLTGLSEEGVISPINGVEFGDTEWSSLELSQWLAGKYSATPLTQSLTYTQVPGGTDVTLHLTTSELEDALEAGAVVAEYNGRNVRIVSGLTSAGTSLKALSFKQVFSRDVKFYLEENYIGKVPNGENQRLSAEGMLKTRYMDQYVSRGVIAPGYTLKVLPGEKKNQVVVQIEATILETMEQIFIHFREGAEA